MNDTVFLLYSTVTEPRVTADMSGRQCVELYESLLHSFYDVFDSLKPSVTICL